jgi:hypothetical protein
MRGRVLEAFLKAERDLASCGRGSQPRAREVRGNDGRVLRPGCEELSLQASAPMPEWEARVPGPKIAKVERREGECTAARCTPRLASAAKFAPLGAPPPLIVGRQDSLKTRALQRRGNERCRANGMQAGHPARSNRHPVGGWVSLRCTAALSTNMLDIAFDAVAARPAHEVGDLAERTQAGKDRTVQMVSRRGLVREGPCP